MIRGLYTSASGMQAQMHRMNALSNNIANVDLIGYKRDQSVHKAFPELLIRRMEDDGVFRLPIGSIDAAPIVGKIGTGVEYNESYTVFTQGALKKSENPFDLALAGKGFFAIQTVAGERYTRNGSFVLGKEGLLLTKDGLPVLGERGPIKLKKNNFVVDAEGRIYQNRRFASDSTRLVTMMENDWEETELVDRLKLVDFKRFRYLKKQGNSLWLDTPESGSARVMGDQKRPQVRQFFLESSNVNPVREMVAMIEVNRAYEANQKSISAQDRLLGRLINNVGRY